MNILLYYPRLIAALVFRPLPHTHETLQHWVQAQLFWLWNDPWDSPNYTFGMTMVELRDNLRKIPFDRTHWKARLKSTLIRYFYLLLLFAWPFFSGLIALRSRNNKFAYWNKLIDHFVVFAAEPWFRNMRVARPLNCTLFYAPLMYFHRNTDRRIPDRKDEIYFYSQRFGIPTPKTLSVTDQPQPGRKYIVKPIQGSGAQGILFTSDPTADLGNPEVIVQEAVRNPWSLRRIWGTDALGSYRFITRITPSGEYEVAGCVLRIPLGDSQFDNSCLNNAYAAIDSGRHLKVAYTDLESEKEFVRHPDTGEPIEGAEAIGYAECADLAVKTHLCLAPGMPVLNSDLAITEQGPVLIEINRSPGQYGPMHINGYSEKCVASICWALRLFHDNPDEWRRLATKSVTEVDSMQPPMGSDHPVQREVACVDDVTLSTCGTSREVVL